MSQPRTPVGRRTFLAGLLTGAGALTVLGAVPRKAAATKERARNAPAVGPVLYRRTEEAERYYKTLYK